MNISELIKDTKFWAGISETDTTSYTNAEIIRSYNFNLDLIITKLTRVSGTWQFDDSTYTDMDIATNNLVANQDNYTIGNDMARIQRLRVKDTNGTWITLTPKDRRELSDTDLNSTGTPMYYDKIGSSLMLYPVADYSSTGGIEIQYQRGANYIDQTDVDNDVALGISPQILRWASLLAALDYTETNEMENRSAKIRNRIQEMEAEALALYSDRDRDGVPYLSVTDASDFTDNLYEN